MGGRQVAVIGAGPGGIAAAIQLRRYDIEPLLFEQSEVGGLLRNAHRVENYPGFPRGVSGPELVRLMREQLGRHDVDVLRERVISLDFAEDRFHLRTAGSEFSVPVAVVASGTEARKIPELAIPDNVMGRVFYEVYPLRDARLSNIAVIGAGDAAFDYALSLARRNEVTMLSRSASHRCNPRLWEEAAESLHISHIRRVEVTKVAAAGGKLLLHCAHLDRADVTKLNVDYLVIAVGREPATHFMTRGLAEQSAYLALAHRLHMVGDVRNGLYRQASISVGNGVEAAMDIARHMNASG